MLRFLLILAAASALWAQAGRDQAIEREIARRLERSVIGEEGFRVQVKDGVAYWSGQTAVAQRKGAATRMAKSAGAARVVNNIRVTSARKAVPKRAAAAPAPETRSEPQPAPPAPAAPRKAQVEWKAAGRR